MRVSFTCLLLIVTVFVSAQEIHLAKTPVIGGIRQYITIDGKDASKPLLLFLHGGPGGSVLSYAKKITGKLEEHFVVIHWDQRETGKTLALNPSPDTLTFALFQSDTHELIQYLLHEFKKEKLFLMGHSWGTALGFQMVRQFPDLLYAYISIGSMVDQIESEKLALEKLKLLALKKNNTEAIEELRSIEIPFRTGLQLYYHRKWLFHFIGPKKSLSREYVEDWAQRWLHVYNEACAVNLFRELPAAMCPIYFCAGRTDYQTNSWLTEKYFNALLAPKKFFTWFEKSGHGIPTSEPEKLQALLIEKVLPDSRVPAH